MPSGNHNEAFSQSFNKVISSHFPSLTFYLLKEGEFTSHKHWVIFQTSKIKCFHACDVNKGFPLRGSKTT